MKIFKVIGLVMIALATALPAHSESFGAYPVPVYTGKVRYPDFKGAQKQYSLFRTRLGNAARREKSEFSGSWMVEQIGCGTSCTFGFVIDHKTGAIVPLPVGGEETPNLMLFHRADSRLLKATWFDKSWFDGDCKIGQWTFQNGQFHEVSITTHVPREDCDP